jgi:integrase
MPSERLTAIAVEKLRPPALGRFEVHDLEVPGLVLRVSASGVKSWSLTYRFRGNLRRLTLGQYPGVSLKLAHERARQARALIQRGADPVAEKQAEQRATALSGFATCKADFIERYAKARQRTWAETERILDRLAVPVWSDRPVQEIRRRDVADLLDDVAAETPAQSNQLRAHLSKLFNWLIEREVVEVNPVVGVARRHKYVPRARVLSDDELVAFWNATKGPALFGPICRLLLLTGMRPEEAAGLRWDELDGDWAALPGSRMKNGRDFRAPLSAAAKAIIAAQPRRGPFVFTSDGRSHFALTTKAREPVHAAMERALESKIERWTPHDLRRTLSTGLASLGVPNEVIDRVTAHVPQRSNVTAFVYNRHRYDAEAMEAVQRWAAHVARLTSGIQLVGVVG